MTHKQRVEVIQRRQWLMLSVAYGVILRWELIRVTQLLLCSLFTCRNSIDTWTHCQNTMTFPKSVGPSSSLACIVHVYVCLHVCMRMQHVIFINRMFYLCESHLLNNIEVVRTTPPWVSAGVCVVLTACSEPAGPIPRLRSPVQALGRCLPRPFTCWTSKGRYEPRVGYDVITSPEEPSG